MSFLFVQNTYEVSCAFDIVCYCRLGINEMEVEVELLTAVPLKLKSTFKRRYNQGFLDITNMVITKVGGGCILLTLVITNP